MPLSTSPTHSARSTDSTDCSAASRSSPVRAMSSSWRGGRATVDWETPPSRVLVAATPHSAKATAALPVVCNFLRERCRIQPLVEEKLRRIAGDGVETLRLVDGKVVDPIDFVICLGGDGLILHVVSTLFPAEVPPIMPFNMGSMGFLTPFDFADHAQEIPRIIKGNHVPVAVRMRLRCAVIRKTSSADADDAPNGVQGCFHNFEDNMLLEEDVRGAVGAEYHVLNELVIDRGPAPYLSNLEVLCDNCPVTRVQADGLIVATPTGSTAYSLSSGGSMVHPGVPAILFTPICPHSLSFRPVLFPDYVTLQIKVPEDARASAWVSFDGRHRMELMRGDYVVVTVSPWSVPTFSKTDATTDWFRSVSTCLRWNERVTQESMEQSDVA